MRSRWLEEAATDLESISDYLLEHRPQQAASTVLKVYESIRTLKASPYIAGGEALR